MILFTILLLMLVLLTIFSVVVLSALGAGGIIIFGDVIVCICLIVKVLKLLIKRRH